MNPYPAEWFALSVLMRLDESDGCWLWTGHKRTGYASVRPPGERTLRFVHRIVYEQMVGPIPDGMQLDHVWERGCRHKHCAAPHHLEPVTAGENKRRWAQRITHCPQGHEYTAANRRGGERSCRTCQNEKRRERRAALRVVPLDLTR